MLHNSMLRIRDINAKIEKLESERTQINDKLTDFPVVYDYSENQFPYSVDIPEEYVNPSDEGHAFADAHSAHKLQVKRYFEAIDRQIYTRQDMLLYAGIESENAVIPCPINPGMWTITNIDNMAVYKALHGYGVDLFDTEKESRDALDAYNNIQIFDWIEEFVLEIKGKEGALIVNVDRDAKKKIDDSLSEYLPF